MRKFKAQVMSKLVDNTFNKNCPDIPLCELECNSNDLSKYRWHFYISSDVQKEWDMLTLSQRKLVVVSVSDVSRGYVLSSGSPMKDLYYEE